MDNPFDKTLLENQPQGTIPAPPQKEVEIRTLQSDMQAFKDSGGEVPLSGERHAFASKEETAPAGPALNRRTELESGQIIQPTAGAQPAIEPKKSYSGVTAIIMIVLSLALIAGMGYIGYAYVFPIVFK